jgi:hypothetical protein
MMNHNPGSDPGLQVKATSNLNAHLDKERPLKLSWYSECMCMRMQLAARAEQPATIIIIFSDWLLVLD